MVNTPNSSTSGLRFIGNDRDLDPANCIYERRLANVGSTNKGYKSAAHSYRVVTNVTDCAKKNFAHTFQSALFLRSPIHIARPATLCICSHAPFLSSIPASGSTECTHRLSLLELGCSILMASSRRFNSSARQTSLASFGSSAQ